METLERFYMSPKKIENSNAFLWGIARNKMLEYIRYKGKNQFQELVDWSEIENNQINSNELQDNWLENYRSLEYQAKLERLKECTKNQLSDIDQEIVDLCISQDFKSAEVATKLNITPDNTRQRLSRALKKLREKCREVWINNDLGVLSS